MSLRDYALADETADAFVLPRTQQDQARQWRGDFAFPCCCCAYNGRSDAELPCRACGHNVNAERPAPAQAPASDPTDDRAAGRAAHEAWERTRGSENECVQESRIREGEATHSRDWWNGWMDRSDEWRDEIGHEPVPAPGSAEG